MVLFIEPFQLCPHICPQRPATTPQDRMLSMPGNTKSRLLRCPKTPFLRSVKIAFLRCPKTHLYGVHKLLTTVCEKGCFLTYFQDGTTFCNALICQDNSTLTRVFFWGLYAKADCCISAFAEIDFRVFFWGLYAKADRVCRNC